MSSGRSRRTDRRARVFAALGDPTRLRLVELLSDCREMSGSELARRARISLALLCHHWKVLDEAGLIARRKSGQTAYCALNSRLLRATFEGLLERAEARTLTRPGPPSGDLPGSPCAPADRRPRARPRG
jgi:DNA-binding transcriptional ArsR family regulator